MSSLYDQLQENRAFIRTRLGDRTPHVGLVLGSGLGAFADRIAHPVVIEYGDIPHFPVATVPGHSGRLVVGEHQGLLCMIMQGRVHGYEGASATRVAVPVRTMIATGVRLVIVTNAAGGMHKDWPPGTLMLITDHINLTGENPLRGPNDDRVGSRFPDMTRAYDPTLRELARRAAEHVGESVREGVYAGMAGPTYETPAEIRMLRTLGADACGMSTIHEVIAARHMGIPVLGMSCITNYAAGITGAALSHDEVMETSNRTRERFERLLDAILQEIANTEELLDE